MDVATSVRRSPPCVTVDVEDFEDGMEVLGRDSLGGGGIRLGDLIDTLAETGPDGTERRLTFFVVGRFAASVGHQLRELAAAGHEVASHGPDHGRPPPDPGELESWLRQGREMVEDVVRQPVTGFRTPRFDRPSSMTLDAYRDAIGRAGFAYVSDDWAPPRPHPVVVDLPVTRAAGFRLGGGSYQRMLPRRVVSAMIARCPSPAVLYYHSYDFSWSDLPPVTASRSLLEVRQLALRRRVRPVFVDVLRRFGSRPCREVADGLRPVL